MGKLKYLTRRILEMDYKSFFKTIDDVKKRSGKNRIFLFFDIVICGLKYQAGYMDYQLFEMYKMNSKERKTIVTRGKNNEITKKYNNKEFLKYFDNKILFNQKFNKYLNREWLELKDLEEFKKFIKGKKEIIVKPISGTHGKKVEKIDVSKRESEELFNYLVNEKTLLVEEVATQARELSSLHPTSINTVRLVTLKGKAIVAFLRIGNHNNVVDNFNNGGLAAPIDIKDGVIKYPAIDKNHNEFKIHPLTQKEIVGFKVPNWDKVIKLCEEASKVIPEVGYVGWDVCVAEDEPLLIEGNDFPGHDIYQLPPHRDGNIGLYPIFEQYMKEG